MLPNKYYKVDPCDNLLKKIRPEQPKFEKGNERLEKLVTYLVCAILLFIVSKLLSK